MRILFLNHPESDYGGYCLYNGLCEILGPENVVDWPLKKSYHGETDTYPSNYPGKEGTEGVTGPLEWAVPRPAHDWTSSRIEAALQLGTFDLVVCESPRARVLQSLRQLADVLRGKPIVMHDGEDHDRIHDNLIREFGIGLYLKRELVTAELARVERVAGFDAARTVRSFCFSSSAPGPLASAPRPVDVMCAVGDTHPVRARMRAFVERLGREGFSVDVERTGWRDYVSRMGSAKICVAPRGFGQDTLRRWEIPAAGALMFAERLTLLEDQPLRDGEHCVLYSPDGSDFEAKIRWWLAHEDDRARVAAAGQVFLMEHHTNAAKAKKLLGWAKGLWGIE